jgi:hypothetical protein
MSIEIREKFEVAAPIDAVWRFVLDPNLVAPCLPGAQLEEVIDERTFLGGVKIKIGAITTQYKGKVELTRVDEAARQVEMSAEGRETSGGLAKARITSTLATTASGGTEVIVEATADLTGKVMQVGSRMIEGVSKQLFQQFAKRLRAKLESQQFASDEAAAVATAPAPESDAPVGAPTPAPNDPGPAAREADEDGEALSIVPLILRAIWDIIAGFFRSLFGGRR